MFRQVVHGSSRDVRKTELEHHDERYHRTGEKQAEDRPESEKPGSRNLSVLSHDSRPVSTSLANSANLVGIPLAQLLESRFGPHIATHAHAP
jgi:hypothetical protein